MNQQSIAVIMLAIVVLFFGGIVVHDAVSKNRLGINANRTNWKWSDDWNNTNPVAPIKPQQNPIQPPVQPPVQPPSQQGQIVADSFSEAVAKAQEHNKPILVFFEADWCSWCQKMKKETLTNASVKTAMQKYVFLRVNTDKDRETAKKFNVKALPTFVIAAKTGEKLHMEQGYKDANDFVNWLNGSDTQPRSEPEVKPQPKPQPQPQPRPQPRGG